MTNDQPTPRLDVILGDRCCANCGFNLMGQPIMKEPHYGILSATCPECGTLASLSTYPPRTDWMPHLWRALMLLWLLTILAVVVLGAAGMYGIMAMAKHELSGALAQELVVAHGEWYRSLSTEQMEATTVYTFVGAGDPATYRMLEWSWAESDRTSVLAEMGGHFGALDRPIRMLPLAIPVFLGAAFVAPLLPALRARGLVLFGLAITGLAGLMMLADIAANPVEDPGTGTVYSWALAWQMLGPAVAILTLPLVTLATLAGLLLGRPLARLATRTLLPPPMRGPLAFLWRADALDPPGTRPPGSARVVGQPAADR